MKGYRLHDARIDFSGGTGSMRSIKYELVDTPNTPGLRDKVAEAITHDYRLMYGPVNFEDYLRSPDSPSLLEFWLKALSLGFVFSNQNSIESEFLKYLGKRSVWESCYHELTEEVRNTIDEANFQQFLLKSHRSVEKKTLENRQKIIFNLAKKDADTTVLQVIAQRWADDFSSDNDQLEFKCQIFNISLPEISERSMSLSFAIDPAFVPISIDDRTEFMDQIIEYYKSKKRLSSEQTKKFLGIGDNGNYFNGLFGGLLELLKADKAQETADFINETYELGDSDEIKRRLDVLKQLADQIGEPKLVNKWSDYRIDFNGTIESWYSGREGKQQATIEQLDGVTDKKTGEMTGGLVELLKDLREALPDECEVKDGILQETTEYLKSHGRRVTREFTDELDSYLATLRSDLNEWSQHNKDVTLPERWQSRLSKHVQSSPLFFGENKVQLWKQLTNLKSLIRNDLDSLTAIVKGKYDDYEILDKQIDMLARLSNRITSDGNPRVISVLKSIQDELGLNFSDRTELDRYYISGFERAKVRRNEISKRITIHHLVNLADLTGLLELASARPEQENLLRDATQLLKIVVSALVRGGDQERVVSLLTSNLSGYANLLSRQVFVSRATVQSANGGQLTLATKDNKYYYAFNSSRFAERDSAMKFKKTYNFSTLDIGDKVSDEPYLAVQSSYYQVQFLDWFMGKHKKKKTILGAGGAFSIAEKTVEIDWSGEKPTIKSETDYRVFVSQPFEIKPLSEGRQVPENRFIGIDIGEYGLAYCLVEVNEGAVKVEKTGFIEDRQQRKLKYAVKSLRDNQVRSTFNAPNSLVARIRESLVGSYRNQLEDLAMKSNARLSFEFEVSNFETGSSRISKIYSSIKRGDIKKRDNNAENKMAWGDRGQANWGVETTAAGTSQTCSKCRRWASLAIEDAKTYELSEYDDRLFRTSIGDGEVRLLTKKDTGSSVKGRELKGLIYKAMRPNEDGLGMEIVKRRHDWTMLSDEFGAGKPRGNIGIYICPYLDCLHISDADIQAALNIAIRGYLKYSSDKAIKTAEQFVVKSAEMKFEEIGLGGESS